MFVGSVCTHKSYNDKNPHSVFFLSPILKYPFSNQAVLRFLSELCSFCTDRSHDSLLTRPSYLRPALSELLTVRPPLWCRGGCLQLRDWCDLLLDVIMSSRHLLPTSEPLKTQTINVTLVFKGNPPIPDLPKCIYVWANHLWSSLTYRRSENTFFLNLCKSAFFICAS